ncbi:hypothetical protein [Aeromonas sp. R7-1]|uniref:hypothetical protein n=1 Tax=Aeromonas sp. R7-1 TaxID=3138473 RepID=UPI0034A477B0
MANRYAVDNPDATVIIIDLSPQCDVSRMMLGGGHLNGEQKILDLMQQRNRPTVYSYLDDCINDLPAGQGWPDTEEFILNPNTLRSPEAEPLPDNIKLVCGDFDLERITYSLDNLNQPQARGGRVPTGAFYSAFLLPRTFIRKMVEDIEDLYDNAIIFIDTDPYYSVVTTHLGLLGADNLICAYSPSSQASQFAVYRSLEFLYAPTSSLTADVDFHLAHYPQPWYDSKNNEIELPEIKVTSLDLIISNMNTPQGGRGDLPYARPQRLHRQAFDHVADRVAETLDNIGARFNYEHDYMWDLKRLGLICDYNGMDLTAIELRASYPQPGEDDPYYVNATGGTPIQLEAYKARLKDITDHL